MPKAQSHPLSRSLGYHIRQLSEAWSNALHGRMSAEGISLESWRYLREIFQKDGMSNAELSQLVGRRGPTTVMALRAMERARLVETRQSADDKRKITIHLTEQGAAIWQKAAPLLELVQGAATQGIDPEELRIFKKVLVQSLRNLDALDGTRGESAVHRTDELAGEIGLDEAG